MCFSVECVFMYFPVECFDVFLVECVFYVFQWSAIVKVKEDGTWQGTLQKNLGEDISHNLTQYLGLDPGDLLMLTAGEHIATVSICMNCCTHNFDQTYHIYSMFFFKTDY